MTRERRERMTETFVAVGDALQRSPVPVFSVVLPGMPRLPRPSYLPDVPSQTKREYLSALGKLGKLGIVRVN